MRFQIKFSVNCLFIEDACKNDVKEIGKYHVGAGHVFDVILLVNM